MIPQLFFFLYTTLKEGIDRCFEDLVPPLLDTIWSVTLMEKKIHVDEIKDHISYLASYSSVG